MKPGTACERSIRLTLDWEFFGLPIILLIGVGRLDLRWMPPRAFFFSMPPTRLKQNSALVCNGLRRIHGAHRCFAQTRCSSIAA